MKKSGILIMGLGALVFAFQGIANHNTKEALQTRVAQVGTLNVESAEENNPEDVANIAINGQEIYQSACFACHGTGVPGAPQAGSAIDWNPRAEKGMETLLSSAINGIGAMPARGGRGDLSDEQIRAAVQYILDQSQ